MEIRDARLSENFPKELSFFQPHLQYFVKEILAIGGEAKLSLMPSGEIAGLFIYDNYERTGSVFTRSKEVFDHFYGSKPFVSLFSEFESEHPKLTYKIVSMEIDKAKTDFHFRHQVSIDSDVQEVEAFMLDIHPGMNKKWVKHAMSDGVYKCFTVKVGNEIIGMSWLALINRIGWMPDLYVKPQFRRMRIARDLFFARLMYLKLKRAKSYYGEIGQDNDAALNHALSVGLNISGTGYYYYKENANVENPLNEVSSLQ